LSPKVGRAFFYADRRGGGPARGRGREMKLDSSLTAGLKEGECGVESFFLVRERGKEIRREELSKLSIFPISRAGGRRR